MTARSYLYVPGDRGDVLAKAAGRRADALIIDLEDAVALSAKAAARSTVADYLASYFAHHGADHRADAGSGADGLELWVRINPGEAGVADLAAVVGPALHGVCVAKTESATELVHIDAELTRLEGERGVAAGTVAVCPLLESAAAVTRVGEIAAAPRVVRLQVGEADLKADLGVETAPDERELLWVRSAVVLASAAAGIAPPVGPVSINFRDLDALRESTISLKRMGYYGRTCIHPAQVAVINEVFTPSAEQLAQARDLLSGYDQAAAEGSGVFTDADGRMIDLAVVRSARRLVEGSH